MAGLDDWMVNAAGEKFATINKDGNIELTLNTGNRQHAG